MNKEVLYEYYKECYYHELQQKDNINNRVGIPLGIVPLLVAADVYFVNNIEYINEYWKLMTQVTVTIFTIGTIVFIYYLFRTLFNHKVGYVSSLEEVHVYWESLNHDGYEEDIIAEEMSEFIGEQFKDFATLNRTSNIKKINLLRRAFYCLIITFITGIFACYPFAFEKNDDADIIDVKVIDSRDTGGKYHE